MSYGELCKSRIFVTDKTNSIDGHWLCCSQYAGHDGIHSTSLKCVTNTTYGDQPGYRNNHVGTVQWTDELADKKPTPLKR